jgi:hypothetical protein
MKKLLGVAQLEEACRCAPSIKKHDELKSFGRFWYQEIRDFLIRRHTVRVATVAEIYKALWAFFGIVSPGCSGFQNQSHFFGVARSTNVGSPFRNTSRVGGGVEIKKNCHFRSN